MAEYKLLYVDEVPSERRRFQLYIHNNDIEKKFVIDAPELDGDLDIFVEKIMHENYDAIITDHKLNEENSNIKYDGIELVEAILKEKLDFPCFIFTSFDDEAVRDGHDVNIVYIKDLIDSDEEQEGYKAKFIDKIENQIKHYRKRIANAKEELLSLMDKQYLDAKDEARLIELDSYIEKTTSHPSGLPPQLKSNQNLSSLHHLIKNTDKLLEEFTHEISKIKKTRDTSHDH